MSDKVPPEQKESVPEKKRREGWIAGAVLILVGVVFIVNNLSGFTLRNWWALFILIPALGSLGTAWSVYRKNGGKLTAGSRGPLIGGLVLLTVTAIFLFGLNWGAVWPVFPILIGVGLILGAAGK